MLLDKTTNTNDKNSFQQRNRDRIILLNYQKATSDLVQDLPFFKKNIYFRRDLPIITGIRPEGRLLNCVLG